MKFICRNSVDSETVRTILYLPEIGVQTQKDLLLTVKQLKKVII